MRVILTRPEREARQWVGALAQAGMDVISMPLIAIDGPPDPPAVVRAWQSDQWSQAPSAGRSGVPGCDDRERP